MIVFEVSYAGSRYLLVNGVSKYYAAASKVHIEWR